MLQQVQKYWRVFWTFRRLTLMWLLEYRADFVFWSFVSVMWTVFNYFFIGVFASVKGEIAGWTVPQLMILLSTYTILDSFTWGWFYQNMMKYTSFVYDGRLSDLLVKPIDTQFLLMIQDNTYNNFLRLVIGVGTLFGSIWWWQIPVSFLNAGLYFGLLLVSLTFIYSLWFLIATCTFWVERLNNIHEILPGFRQVYQLPRTIFTGWLSVLFSLVFPLALITSVPSEILFSLQALPWAVYLTTVTFFLAILSRVFFKVSLAKYTSVGG